MSLILPKHYAEMVRDRHLQARVNAIAYGLAHEVGKAYPGHEFDITVQPEQGTVFIDYAAVLSGTKVRYVVHNVDDVAKVIRFCGEILERAGLKRGEIESLDAVDEASDRAKAEFRTQH